jgi:hypothetical protein
MEFEAFEVLEGTFEEPIRISVDDNEMEINQEIWRKAYELVSSVESGMGIPEDAPEFQDSVVKTYLELIANTEEVAEEVQETGGSPIAPAESVPVENGGSATES